MQDAIDRLASRFTMVVIAHRLSTIQNASRIAVIDGRAPRDVVAERIWAVVEDGDVDLYAAVSADAVRALVSWDCGLNEWPQEIVVRAVMLARAA